MILMSIRTLLLPWVNAAVLMCMWRCRCKGMDGCDASETAVSTSNTQHLWNQLPTIPPTSTMFTQLINPFFKH